MPVASTLRGLSDYEARRSFDGKAFRSVCYAPFVSLLFDPKGFVRACCQDWTHSLGNVAHQRLGDIWSGPAIAGLRKRLSGYDLPEGCATCRWHIEQGSHDGAFSRNYDRFPVADPSPPWPQAMEFMLSNACNLECVQCFGELSSAIRARREHLPPLPKAYPDEFFEDLRAFLPHLTSATFLGGEPFLSRENFRVWDMMAEDAIECAVVIVTNGTVFNDRVQGVLDRFSCRIHVSLDGATKDTVEQIRRNARFDELLTNIRRFKAHARLGVGLSFCVMPQNCHEFPDFLLLAEELECDALTNKVYYPPQFSMNALPARDLAAALAGWEARDAQMQDRLQRHRAIWTRELDELRCQAHASAGRLPLFFTGICGSFGGEGGQGEAIDLERARSLLRQWCGDARVDEIRIDADDTVVQIDGGFAGVGSGDVSGRPMSEIFARLRDLYGADVNVTETADARTLDRTMNFVDPAGRQTAVRWIALARDEHDSLGAGAVLLAAARPGRPTGFSS